MNLNTIKDGIRTLTQIGYKCLPCRVVLSDGKKAPSFGAGFGWTSKTGPEYLPARLAALGDRMNGCVVITGGGLLVVDLDRKLGHDPDGALRQAGISLPQQTPRARTPHGEHYYFRQPAGVVGTHANLYDGVDTRGSGGFVYCTPTDIKNYGTYQWLCSPDVPLADCPDTLVQHLRDIEQGNGSTTYNGHKRLNDLTPGQRAILDERLAQAQAEAVKEPGPGRDRSRYDFRLMCWAVSCGLSEQTIRALVQNVGGKFTARGDYFERTFNSVLHRAR